MFVQLSICSLQNSRHPLHVAVEKGHTSIVSLLLTHGANADSKDKVRNLYKTLCLLYTWKYVSILYDY